MKRKLTFVLWGSFILFSLLAVFYYPQLPETVASHFNIKGKADSYLSKEAYVLVQIAVLLLITLGASATSKFIPRSSGKLLNLPNKSYWLAEERKEETLYYISVAFLKIGAATNILLGLVFTEATFANLHTEPKLGASVGVLVLIYVAAITLFLFQMIKRFSIKEKNGK